MTDNHVPLAGLVFDSGFAGGGGCWEVLFEA